MVDRRVLEELAKHMGDMSAVMAETTNDSIFLECAKDASERFRSVGSEIELFNPWEAYKFSMEEFRRDDDLLTVTMSSSELRGLRAICRKFADLSDRQIFQHLCHKDSILAARYLQFIYIVGGFVGKISTEEARDRIRFVFMGLLSSHYTFALTMDTPLVFRELAMSAHDSTVMFHRKVINDHRGILTDKITKGEIAEIGKYINMAESNYLQIVQRQKYLIDKNEA